ncbi:outer membrane beta-barrel protein [Chromohalobacter canadensis]|uniref:OmpW/AlkL family protein n=1 Tax=Chromohalobacter canadensis TaxID=141389 RepID=UPI0021BF4DDD|nr:OmpW family outer membrane protein [Chromohalobacter canadensis]MCT8468884.1 outer membrane beta-barrel protein [Chromohalobacter canadensis]MCT8472926.1 outer membrane beta-barrel protein [Chromohalobacter canadensis]MCT8500378.1 outer membrane beta-barrel protein [Chromohalobacter canadensis]
MRRVLLVSSLALTAALVPATSAFAYGQGDFYTRFGVAKVAPQSDNGDFGAPLNMKIDADDDSGFAFTLGYRFHDKLGVELLAAQRFEHQVQLNGSDMASIHHLPPTLTLQYYPLGGTDARVQPYLGAGLNYTHFSDEKLDGGELELDDSWGGAAQLGVDLLIDDHWALNAAAWYLDIDSDATATLGGNDYHANVDIDPIVVMGGLSYRF